VQAGFVASEGIANPIAKDFYLLSHGGILGSWCTVRLVIFRLTDNVWHFLASRPAHYIVLKDEIFNFDIRP
jgi:eukaryotic translation initiation factor 2C